MLSINRLIMLVVFAGAVCTPISSYAFDWRDLWSSPEQRAQKQHRAQQYDQLSSEAPDALWRGVGQFRSGDFESSSASFAARRQEARQSGNEKLENQATYNQANAEVMLENYQKAIELYDQVLQSQPQHASAQHNKDIAEQLLQLQQQSNPSGDQQGDSESSANNEEKQNGQSGESGSDQQNNQQGEQQGERGSEQGGEQQGQQSGSNNSNSGNNSGDSSDSTDPSGDQLSEAEQAAAAEQAMAAERANAGQLDEAEPTDSGNESAAAASNSEPLSEREQANEQWLRQIPDDPAGLLQRKLQNRHLTDYPTVQDSAKPW